MLGDLLPNFTSTGALLTLLLLAIPILKRIYRRALGTKITSSLDRQSIVLTGSSSSSPDGQREEVHACPPTIVSLSDEKKVTYGGRKLLHYLHEDARTAYAALQRAVRLAGDADCLGSRPPGKAEFQWLSYTAVDVRVTNLCAGMIYMGCRPKERIGILSPSRTEAVVAEYACHCHSMVAVWLDHKANAAVLEHILDETFPPTVFCHGDRLDDVLKACVSKSIAVKRVIVIGSPSAEAQELASQCEISVKTIEEVEALGKANPAEFVHPQPSDRATINYTSGTSGMAKGIMLTHANLVAVSCCLSVSWKKTGEHAPVVLSLGAPSHVIYRHIILHSLLTQGCIGFYEGHSLDGLMEDMRILAPTLLIAVPALLNAMKQHFNCKAAKSPWLQYIMKWQVNAVRQGYNTRGNLLDRLFFRSLQAKVGGRLERIAIGAATMSTSTAQFARAAFGCSVVEGYGTTESCAGGTLSHEDDTSHGNVGYPLLCNHLKVASVEKMGYDSFYGQGEVCIKGTNVAEGYWTKDGGSLDIVDEHGWLHTGDIGRWRRNGTLEIIDRMKNVIRLSIGMDVAPDHIEAIFRDVPYVQDFFLYGSSSRGCCVAVAVPMEELLVHWLRGQQFGVNQGLSGLGQLCQNETVRRAIMRDLTEHAQRQGLASHELPFAIFLSPVPFDQIPGLVTSTRKLRRNHLKEHFAVVIEEMYSKLKPKLLADTQAAVTRPDS